MRLAVVTVLLASSGVISEAAAESIAPPWDGGAPFVIRDQNPLLAGLGLPSTLPSRLSHGVSGGIDLYWGSTALMQESGGEAMLVDAETREVRLTLQGTITDRIGWHVQLPYRYTGGGSLDGFIDSWHDTFGLPEGARPQLSNDQIDIIYVNSGTRRLNIRSSASGLADIHAALGFEMYGAPDSALLAWLNVKLPTGDADQLTGSGATDVSLALTGRHRLGDRWSLFGQAAGTWLGDGELLSQQQRSVVWSGMAGVSVRTWGRLSLKAQLDAHTATYDSNLDFFSEAVVLTVGGDYEFESGWRLDLGVSEDLAVEHSPDVVFLLSVRNGPR